MNGKKRVTHNNNLFRIPYTKILLLLLKQLHNLKYKIRTGKLTINK